MDKDASGIARIFGTVMARVGWRQLFRDFLGEGNQYLASKEDAIRFVILKYKDDQIKLIEFFHLLFSEHREITVANKALINDHLRPFGLSLHKTGCVGLAERGGSFLAEIDDLLIYYDKKEGKRTSGKNTGAFEYHLRTAQQHFSEKHWDDMVSQLRKTLELLINSTVSRYADSIPPSVNGQLNLLVEKSKLVKNEKDLVYALYGMLSDKGAHPGIPDVDEALLKYRLSLETMRFLVKIM